MKFLRALAVFLVSLGVAAAAGAQTADERPRGNISGFGSFALTASDGLDKGHGGGVSGAYFFSDAIGVEGAFAFRTFDVGDTTDNALTGGELSANTVSVNVVGRFAAGSIQPYISGGVVFFMNDYTIDAAKAAELDQFNFASGEAIENTVGFNVGGGIDFLFSSRIGAFVEGRYTAATADTTGGLRDEISGVEATLVGEQKINFVAFNGGIRIFF